MRAIIDEDACTGCGLCEETCPEVFKLNDDGVATVIVDEIPEDVLESAEEAAENCPVEAIKLEEE